jgi:hypothetical protein
MEMGIHWVFAVEGIFGMKRFAIFTVLLALGAALPILANAQQIGPGLKAAQTPKQARQQQKMNKKGAKNQQKAMKKFLKAQKKANKKAQSNAAKQSNRGGAK